MVCLKGTRLQTRMRTGTGEAEAMAGRAADGAVAPPWKAETRRAAEGAAAAAAAAAVANRRREEEGIWAAATAVDGVKALRRLRAAAAIGREEEEAAAVAAERILGESCEGRNSQGGSGRRCEVLERTREKESDGNQKKVLKSEQRKNLDLDLDSFPLFFRNADISNILCV